jgi:hypothetical protein
VSVCLPSRLGSSGRERRSEKPCRCSPPTPDQFSAPAGFVWPTGASGALARRWGHGGDLRRALGREVTGIDQGCAFNRALWAPTERRAELRSKTEV